MVSHLGPYVHTGQPLQAHHVSKILSVPLRTVRHWAKTGRLGAFKDPKRPKIWLFEPAGVSRFHSGVKHE
jgi:hypothetical protein